MAKQEPLVEVTCQRCGVKFLRKAWRVRQMARMGQAAMFCGYSCSRAGFRTKEYWAEFHRAYRVANRESINRKQKDRRVGPDREHVLAAAKAAYQRNVEKNRDRARYYAVRHPMEAKVRLKQWAVDNPERVKFHRVRSGIAQSAGILPRQVPAEYVERHIAYLNVRRAVLDAKRKTP